MLVSALVGAAFLERGTGQRSWWQARCRGWVWSVAGFACGGAAEEFVL